MSVISGSLAAYQGSSQGVYPNVPSGGGAPTPAPTEVVTAFTSFNNAANPSQVSIIQPSTTGTTASFTVQSQVYGNLYMLRVKAVFSTTAPGANYNVLFNFGSCPGMATGNTAFLSFTPFLKPATNSAGGSAVNAVVQFFNATALQYAVENLGTTTLYHDFEASWVQ